MKYIIDIKPEYEDKVRGVMILGTENSNLYVDSQAVDELEELNSDYINEHFGELQDRAYQKGFEEGKAQNDNGCMGCAYVGLKESDEPCVRCSKCYKNQYRAKKKDDEIKVGDEVTHKSDSVVWKAVCIQIDGDGRHMNLMGHTGAVGYYPVDDFKKTGRHFDIDKILEAMKE